MIWTAVDAVVKRSEDVFVTAKVIWSVSAMGLWMMTLVCGPALLRG